MDRLLAGPLASLRRATFRKQERAARRAGKLFPEASPPLSSRHAGAAHAKRSIARAPNQPAFMAAGVCAIQDTKKEDFLDKTTTAPAEFIRAAEAAMPLAMRAAKKTAAKKPARKAAAKKPARKAAPKKAAAKRTATARKPAARKAAAKKPARKAAAKKPAARKAAAKKPAAKKAAAKRTVRRPRKAAAAAPAAPAEAAS
jgi:hypothetical protein